MNQIQIKESMKMQLIADRRHFHQHPELSHEETNTMQYICNRLDALGITYRAGIAKTGVLAQVDGKEGGKCLLIRADMDALPIEETNDVPYRSQNPGVMHACGHDAHTAILLNACQWFHENKDAFCGTVKFAFQPAEETDGGALSMIEDGVLENPTVSACIALHADTDLPAGTIRIKEGAMYASPDDFYITIHGKSAHGAEPHLAIDPIVIAAQVVLQLQTLVSRNTNPFENAVVSVGAIHGGDATNIIPNDVQLKGTARAFSEEMRFFLEKRIEEVVKNACLTSGATYDYTFDRLYPPLMNDKIIAQGIYESAVRTLGKENVIKGGLATMAGEDFSYFGQKVPSALFKLGCRNEEKGIVAPIHNSAFDIDENALTVGLKVFADFALSYLNN